MIPFHGHMVSGRLWPIGLQGAAVVRGRLSRVEAAELPLPLRPEPIDVAVKKEEQRISRRRVYARDEATEARVRGSMRIALHVHEVRVLIAKAQRLRLGAGARAAPTRC